MEGRRNDAFLMLDSYQDKEVRFMVDCGDDDFACPARSDSS